jgi:probable phosphoglycerate mutase
MIAIVSHGDPLRSLLAYYLGISPEAMLRFEISPASVSVLEASEWTSRVVCVNDRGGELREVT